MPIAILRTLGLSKDCMPSFSTSMDEGFLDPNYDTAFAVQDLGVRGRKTLANQALRIVDVGG